MYIYFSFDGRMFHTELERDRHTIEVLESLYRVE